ncbi:MAG: DEAD/DEAH box helicase [Deltaproteobacteria bacterium]|nr:DEAD/DEAH box helicase [Deltaproteobacteria bacterium]
MSWILDAIGAERVGHARSEADRRRIITALAIDGTHRVDDAELLAVANALELQVFELLGGDDADALRRAAVAAFQVLRSVARPSDPLKNAAWLLRITCIAVIGDRAADARRLLADDGIPTLPLEDADWGRRVWATTLDTWLRVFRKQGWEDLDRVQANVVALREAQRASEPRYLAELEQRQDKGPGWQLVAEYHLAKAVETLAFFVGQGTGPDGRYDITQQLEAQFDRAIVACGHGGLVELELLTRLLVRAGAAVVSNSIWSVTRAVNSRVTRFVEAAVSRDRSQPLFEMLPPQRRTLREDGLLGSSHRAVVVSLPTSSGKTLIAQFRILQALNQFDAERGWVAYLAPTRALVKQVAVRLRRDFAPLGVNVERVSPALEIDGIEAALLTEANHDTQFRVLVTTPEKLDLMLRGGWEDEIGRPLTLVVVDEAHNLGGGSRGLKLELLLATINRECRNAQFLLLTPFIGNAAQIAQWLAHDSSANVELAVDWVPNDRVIAVAEPQQATGRAGFRVRLSTVHTSRGTLSVPETLVLPTNRPLGLAWSVAKGGQGALAAATAQQLRGRGAVIVLASTPRNSWSIAARFRQEELRRQSTAPEIAAAKAFLEAEFGDGFALAELLDFGVGVHHSGMSDEAKALVEWLTERGQLDVLVATTTIAQGVNFPVSGVVLASHQYPYGEDMPPEDFWNIAGRAGRVDQGDLGFIALAATTAEKRRQLETYVATNVGTLNSTLVEMVQQAHAQGQLLALEQLAWQPSWSSFLQYLVHTYRQIGDHEQFALEVEQVLRGTLGFQELRRSHPTLASDLVRGVRRYGANLAGQPLKLVDSTGFSLETVRNTLGRLSESGLREDAWSADLFTGPRPHLATMMGLLLQVPELRENLEAVLGGREHDGDKLARIVCDWVQGRSLAEMAATHFPVTSRDGALDPTASMTKCCTSLFSKLAQTASWGLAALQTMTFRDNFEGLSEQEQRSLRNLPARVYYGVNSDAALSLRLIGVPRQAAGPLAGKLGVTAETSLSELRTTLKQTGVVPWRDALGDMGPVYRTVWSVVEGEV